MKISLTAILSCLLLFNANGQTITYLKGFNGNVTPHDLGGLGIIKIDEGFKIEQGSPLYYNVNQSTWLFSGRGLTLRNDGKLYSANPGVGDIVLIDISSNTVEPIIESNLSSNGGGWLKCKPDGNFYLTSLGGSLVEYDFQTKEFDHLGFVGVDGVPYQFHTAMTMVNGELYVCTLGYGTPPVFPQYIVKVNTESPLNSQLVMEVPTYKFIRAMTTFNYDCDSSRTYLIIYSEDNTGYDLFELDLKEPSLNLVTKLENITGIADFTNPTEHLRFDCVPSLDLDGQATTQLDYQAAAVCTAPGSLAYPLAGAGPIITTNTIVDSIWVGITGTAPDGSDEHLGCADSPFGHAEANNGGIMLYNVGQAPNEELMDWLRQSLHYQNNAPAATPGTRQLSVVAYNKGYASEAAKLWLPVQPGIAVDASITDATNGSNGSITVSNVTGGPGSGYQFLWSNGQTSQNITGLATGTYSLTVTADGGCSTSYQFTVDGASAVGQVGQNAFGAAIVPNPSDGRGAIMEMTSISGEIAWEVVDATGRVLASGKSTSNKLALPSSLQAGIYSVTIQDGHNRAVLRWVVL